MKLISMREFVLENIENNTGKMKMGGVAKSLHQINEYAKFLSHPLTLGMFVPCDEKGNVLEEPDSTIYAGSFIFEDEMKAYNKAKERVLFEGAKIWNHNGIDYLSISCKGYIIKKGVLFNDNPNCAPSKTNDIVEVLLEFSAPTLTKQAIKQLGL